MAQMQIWLTEKRKKGTKSRNVTLGCRDADDCKKMKTLARKEVMRESLAWLVAVLSAAASAIIQLEDHLPRVSLQLPPIYDWLFCFACLPNIPIFRLVCVCPSKRRRRRKDCAKAYTQNISLTVLSL